METQTKSVKFYFSDVLPKYFPEYEKREEQVFMSEKVEEALRNQRHIVVEAGTGTGKSLAYLIPSVIFSKENKKRIIVSTYTKVLQSQLVQKDLPFVQKVLSDEGIRFNFSVFFGSENYLCLRKFEKYSSSLHYDAEMKNFIDWAHNTETGILNEFPTLKELRDEVSRESDVCLHRRCKHHSKCFYRKAFLKATSSDLLVVNHHLFFTNLASGGRVLPRFDAVIFDEAHNLEEVAMELLGDTLTNYQLKRLCDEIYNPRLQKGLLYRLKKIPSGLKDTIVKCLSELKAAYGEFFNELVAFLPQDKETVRFHQPPKSNREILITLKKLSTYLKEVANFTLTDEELLEVTSKSTRCLQFANIIDEWLSHKDTNYVYWLERSLSPRGRESITICITPVEISEILSEKLFNELSCVVLTSATLAVGGSFDYIRNALGVGECEEILLGSSFDYKKNVVLYVPEDVPDPKTESEKYEEKIKSEIHSLVTLMGGRTFVLFTSYRLLNSVHSELENLSKHNLLKQGTSSNYHIIEKFKTSENAVLFGTDSFWQGVDVPGEALICVIITRLPFEVPEHPVVEAKVEAIKSRGLEPFIEYTLPKAILKFRQGFGRLVRTSSDWGVVAVLDPRLKTRYYGKHFLNSIPQVNITSDILEVERFIRLNN